MKMRLGIGRHNIHTALQALLPKVREAGQLAAALQPKMCGIKAPDQKDKDHAALSALTHADLLLEDRLGSDVLMLFENASFYGEEHASDRISGFIPGGQPYVITLDPINGTLQYRDGLPLYETIVTICDREWQMLGAIVYRPAFDEAFIAWKKEGGGAKAQRHRWNFGIVNVLNLDLTKVDAPNTLHLNETWRPHEGMLNNAGYEFVDIWSGYAGQSDWPYSQADVLMGKCRGMAWESPWSLLIDAAVFGFMTACAGGVWRHGPLNKETLTYSYTIAATDPVTADLLQGLIV